MFYEIVIAPSYTPEGLEVLKGKSKNLRIVEAKPRAPSGLSLRQVRERDGRVCVLGMQFVQTFVNAWVMLTEARYLHIETFTAK